MKIKEIIITIFISLIVLGLFGLNFFANKYILHAESVYEVYLNNEIVGYILDEDELYNLINKKQKEIKDKYKVDNVYPPENFKIIKTNTYDVQISTPENIYNKMAKIDSFTIEGYTITIKMKNKENKYLYVLDKKVFDEAINNFVLAFMDYDEYTNFMNNTQPVIETTGKIIEMMYFDETLTIKKGLVSVNNKIHTDVTELTQYILFGEDSIINSYVVSSGDTIASISNANKLNTTEFLIANPEYTSEDSMLKLGDKVNITLINPIITLSYEVNEVSDSEIPYEKKIVYDNTKPASYSEITTAGITGISRITQKYIVKNGEKQTGVKIENPETIIEKVDQVTTRGGYAYSGITGTYVDDGSTWAWPTNRPSVITSYWAYRWGVFHDGIDISGTGCGSPLYAALDGTVVESGNGGIVGWQGGYNVVLQHANGYFTIYAHMIANSMTVRVGDHVSRGQTIGQMGNTGLSYGCHVHFGLYDGMPYGGGRSINPLSLWN